MLRHYQFPIKGSYYYSAELAFKQQLLKVGTSLYLKPETDNVYDGNALQIWTHNQTEQGQQGYLIGYVPRKLAALWQPLLHHHPNSHPNYKLTLNRALAKGKQLRLECTITLELNWLKHLQMLSWTLWLRQQHATQLWLRALFHG